MIPEEAIFAEVLAKGSVAQRAAYLDAACRDNAHLRAAAEGLLLAHRQADGILETPAVILDTTS